ncbi:MAG: DUF354 domain-containing protein [Gammaproteobacteria bacterium]
MKILIDICHPAHVHFFKNALRLLEERQCEVIVTSRDKDCTIPLLEQLKIPHTPLSSTGFGKIRELIDRDIALYRFVRAHQPDLLVGVGGTFIAQVGTLSRIPSIVFYDGDNAILQNIITYPFADQVIVPRCYQGWLPKHTLRYAGYHELAYLHPHYFKSQASAQTIGKPIIFIRHVAHQANHDLGHHGLSFSMISRLIQDLPTYQFILSAESEIPTDLSQYAYNEPPDQIHHTLERCTAYVGDSPTMASEAALLGVPGIFVSTHRCGNMQELSQRYQLISIVKPNYSHMITALKKTLNESAQTIAARRDFLLNDTIDVTEFIVSCLVKNISLRQNDKPCHTANSSKH